MLVSVGQLARAARVLQYDLPGTSHHANPSYRQIADQPTHGSEPSTVSGTNCEDELVVVTASHGPLERITPAFLVPTTDER